MSTLKIDFMEKLDNVPRDDPLYIKILGYSIHITEEYILDMNDKFVNMVFI